MQSNRPNDISVSKRPSDYHPVSSNRECKRERSGRDNWNSKILRHLAAPLISHAQKNRSGARRPKTEREREREKARAQNSPNWFLFHPRRSRRNSSKRRDQDSRVSLGYTASTDEIQSVARGPPLMSNGLMDDRAGRRGIRRPTSDHSWIRDECRPPSAKAKGENTLSASFGRFRWSRRGATRGHDVCPGTFESTELARQRGGNTTVRWSEQAREWERGGRGKEGNTGDGKQLREGEERTHRLVR